jgi:hypothetical protein
VQRLVLGIAMALVVAACGSSAATVGPASGSPAPSALPAGTYTSRVFAPATTFTVPDGWVLAADDPTYLGLHPVATDVIGLHLFRDPVAEAQDKACPASAEPGIGKDSLALLAWMRSLKGLVVSTPSLVTIGGLSGSSVDIGIAADWTQSCPFANGLPTVPLIKNTDIDRWVIAGDERLRLFLLDAPGGGTVVVDIDAFDGTQISALISAATPIVKSLQFATK